MPVGWRGRQGVGSVRATLTVVESPQTHVYNVKMTCGGCSGAVTKVLTRKKDKGEDIKSFDIDMEAQTVSVETDMSAEDMLAIVKKAGKETSLKETL